MSNTALDLTGQIRSRIDAGKLPDGAQIRIHASLSAGSACGCCDQAIESGDVQFSVLHQEPDGVRHYIAMHAACFHVWRGVVDSVEVRVISPSTTASHILAPS